MRGTRRGGGRAPRRTAAIISYTTAVLIAGHRVGIGVAGPRRRGLAPAAAAGSILRTMHGASLTCIVHTCWRARWKKFTAWLPCAYVQTYSCTVLRTTDYGCTGHDVRRGSVRTTRTAVVLSLQY
jgi:hypothetical protein